MQTLTGQTSGTTRLLSHVKQGAWISGRIVLCLYPKENHPGAIDDREVQYTRSEQI